MQIVRPRRGQALGEGARAPGPGPLTGDAGPQSLLQCTRFEIHDIGVEMIGDSAIAVGFPARLTLVIVSYAVIWFFLSAEGASTLLGIVST